MDRTLLTDFNIESKNSSSEVLSKWRSLVFAKNPRRRFRMIADLAKRREAEIKRQNIQEKLRVAFFVKRAAIQFIRAGKLPERAREEGFGIDPCDLESIVRHHDIENLQKEGGVEGILRKLKTSVDFGTCESELNIRQKLYGVNEYIEKPPRSFCSFVYDALHDLTLIILLFCSVLSLGIGIPTEGWPKGIYDGLGIMISIFLVVLVTSVSDYRQSLKFRDLDQEKKKILIHLTRNGYRQRVPISDIVIGDIVHLYIGDQVPADGLLISGYDLLVDVSSLTGESELNYVDKENPFLMAGTKVQDGSAKMVVTAVGMKTEWGKLREALSECGEDETPLQVKLNGVATLIGKIGLAFAVLTFLVLTIRFIIQKIINDEFLRWSFDDVSMILNYFAISVTIIVVAVPEGLPLAVTLSLAFAMKILMNDRALVRHLAACETMGFVTCICTDKTGTLTANQMQVQKIWVYGESKIVKNNEEKLKSLITENVRDILLQSILLNTSSEEVKGKDGAKIILGSPTESALLQFAIRFDNGTRVKSATIIKVEPFNSMKKKMSTLVSLPGGEIRVFCKGGAEIILSICDSVLDRDGNIVYLSKTQRNDIMNDINAFSSQALRTLCLAFKDMGQSSDDHNIPEKGYTLIAFVGIQDPLRPGVRKAVKQCIDAGITVRMITGDNINTAIAIARECGILTEHGLVIEGSEFRTKSDSELRALIPRIQVMARSTPSDKYNLVKHLKMLGDVVAVTGDGTNDAPALHEANIGISMGISGTEVAKESADIVMMDDDFKTIINVVKWGRAVFINIQKFVQFQLTVNVVALMINFLSACITGNAPLTAVQLLWVNMIMDTLGALALATEPPSNDLMKKSPIGRNLDFITVTMWRNIIGQSIYQLVVLVVFMFKGKQLLKLEGSDADSVLNTYIFNSFVFCQVFNEINSRQMEKKNVFKGIFSNWIFIFIIISTVAFQIIIVEFLGEFTNTVPLSWHLWVTSVLVGFISMIIAVILKCIPVNHASHTSYLDNRQALDSNHMSEPLLSEIDRV